MADYAERMRPLARMPQPEDYTDHYVLLASYANSSTATGAIINCDGGIGIKGFTQPAGGHDL
jgi:cis-2,3-dihydrobiphenyl-2,3-diol dehydrogenase